jgi:hypothetical protein
MTVRCFAALVLLVIPSVASAQQPQPETSRELRGQLGASYNNAGLQNTLELSWLRPASSSTHPMLAGAHFGAGIVHALTPTQMRLGGWVQYSPLSILDIRAGVDPSVYFGTFNSLQGFDSYDDSFDTDARKARAGAKAGLSMRTYVAPTLKLKAGPIVASATAELEWWRSNAAGDFFYEPTRDTLLRSAGDRMISTTGIVMYQQAMGEGTLAIGALHTTARVSDAPLNDIQKLGAIAIREYAGARFGLPRPKVTLVVARYLDDRSKEGQWTAAVAVGFRSRR